jgi:hypothetical protein
VHGKFGIFAPTFAMGYFNVIFMTPLPYGVKLIAISTIKGSYNLQTNWFDLPVLGW